MDAAAIEALLGKLFDKDDLAGNENGGLAGLVRSSDFDEGLGVVRLVAFEAQAAFGHVLALDDFIATLGMADAGGIVDLHTRMLAAIGGRGGGLFRLRQGEHGGSGLAGQAGAGGINGGLRGIPGLRQLARRSVERRRGCRRRGRWSRSICGGWVRI